MYKIQPNSSIVGKNLIYLPTCHSTNDVAKELIQQNDPLEGTVVITGVQTAGKGLRGNSWEIEPHANLTFSVILYPAWLLPQRIFDLTVAMSVGVLQALRAVGVRSTQIKWPNDIYINQKKVGGMLLEPSWVGNHCSSCIVGIGLNVNQTHWEQAPRATSLALETDQNWDLEKLLPTLLESLDWAYRLVQNPDLRSSLYEIYFENLLGYRQWRRFRIGNEELIAQIQGLDDWGRLRLLTEARKELFFDVKEIEFCWD